MRRGLLVQVVVAATFLPPPAFAADEVTTFDRLLESVKRERTLEKAHEEEREKRFLEEQGRRHALLAEERARLARLERRADALRQRFENNERELTEITGQLDARIGDLAELFAVARQAAEDARTLVTGSLVSAEFPDRSDTLARIATRTPALNLAELENLWIALLEEMTEVGKVSTFDATIIRADGSEGPGTVVRVGAFNAVSEGSYLRYLPDSRKLVELARQPHRGDRGLARNLARATSGVHPFMIDPTRGAILSVMVQSPGLRERIAQGGVIGYIILVIGAAGAWLVVQRFVFLQRERGRVNRDLQAGEYRSDNCVGRLLLEVERDAANPGSPEAFAQKVDEITAVEASRIKRGLPALAVLAAVAPLLGLLGTVTGMIQTFQTITLFGTGDPKLMSSGISQALVTTQLGLGVAIPVLLLHSFLSGKANQLIEVLQQQGAARLSALQRRMDRNREQPA